MPAAVAKLNLPQLFFKAVNTRRSSALVLLAVLFASGLTPLLQAASGVQPHACCLRRLHARADRRQFSAPQSRNGNCCPPLTTPLSAAIAGPDSASPLPVSSVARLGHELSSPTNLNGVGFSNRAPPAWVLL
jgi:hypothetical protein